MIKFFRKIRQQLLSQNKLSKYLLYALGEIFLVVLGILIALQINNWNEERKAKKYERKLISELIKTLEDDYELVEMTIAGNTRSARSCEIILTHFEQDLPYHDSLSLHFENAQLWWTMLLKTNAYENAKRYGLDFIQNDSISNFLAGLYETNNRFAEVMDERQALYYNTTVTPVLIHLFQSIDKHWHESKAGNVPNDYEGLKSNETYKAILKTNIGNRRNFNEWVLLSYRNMKKLEKKLRAELDSID